MDILQFLLLAVCCGSIAFTLTKGSIFQSFREWVIDRSTWLGKLIICPYCTSHWVVFGAMVLFHPKMINSGNVVLDYGATTFSLVGLSAMAAGVIFKLFYTAP